MSFEAHAHRACRDEAYTQLLEALESRNQCSRSDFVDLAWEHLSPTGVSWIGFYSRISGEDELLLGPSRDTPACNRIGLHGVCGQSLCSGTTHIIQDVSMLGEDYIACDLADRSEIVIPIGPEPVQSVLDLDSRKIASFGPEDDRFLRACLVAAKIPPCH